MSDFDPNSLPVFDTDAEDGDTLYLVMRTSIASVDFEADPREGYERLSTEFTSLATGSENNSTAHLDNGETVLDFTIEGNI